MLMMIMFSFLSSVIDLIFVRFIIVFICRDEMENFLRNFLVYHVFLF